MRCCTAALPRPSSALPTLRTRLGVEETERPVVVVPERRPRFHELGALRGAGEGGDGLRAHVGRNAGNGARARPRAPPRSRGGARPGRTPSRRAPRGSARRRACRRARSALVSVPYAISWIRSDLKWKLSSSSSSIRSRWASRSSSWSASARSDELRDGRDRPVGAHDGAVFEERALGGIERVEAGREQPVERGGHLPHALDLTRLLHEGDELLDEEGVAAAALEQEGLGVGARLAVEERACQLPRGLLVERVELEGDAVVAAGLGRPPRLDVGTRRGDEHEGAVAQAGEEALAELEGVVGCPVQVGEHQHERRAHRQRLEHGERRSERFVAGAARIHSRARDAFEEEQQALGHPVDLGGLGVGPEHVRGLLARPSPWDPSRRRADRRHPTPAAAPPRSDRTRSGRRRGGTRPRARSRRARTWRSRRARSRAGSCRPRRRPRGR